MTIRVTGANDAPTAEAGDDQTVNEDVGTVTLDGTGSSDPDTGDTLSYTWTQTGTPTVPLANADMATATVTVPSDLVANVALTFTLTVTDSRLPVTDTVIITVRADNDAAVIGGMATGSVTEDATATATGTLTAVTRTASTTCSSRRPGWRSPSAPTVTLA